MHHPERDERQEQEREKVKGRTAFRQGRGSLGETGRSCATWSVSVT